MKKSISIVSFQGLYTQNPDSINGIMLGIANNLSKNNTVKAIFPRVKIKNPYIKLVEVGISYILLARITQFLVFLGLLSHSYSRFILERAYDFLISLKINSPVILITSGYLPISINKNKFLGGNSIHIAFNPHDKRLYELSLKAKEYRITSIDAYSDIRRINFVSNTLLKYDAVITTTKIIDDSYKIKEYKNKYYINLPCISKNHLVNYNKTFNDGKSFTIGFISHDFWIKGLYFLLRAFKMININKSNIKLLIAGNISHESINNYKLLGLLSNNITFLGYVNNATSFISDLDLLVVPSILDGNPSTVYEGMGLQVPVLLTSGCGASSFLSNGTNCLIAAQACYYDLYKKIIWSYSNRLTLHQIGKNGFNYYKKLVTEDMNYLMLDNIIREYSFSK